MRKLYALRWILVPVWIASWLISAPYAVLDDALIHLRYASYLHDFHRITYDGVHFTYGTSSLGYVALLAFLRGFSVSPALPKIVSTIAYLAVIFVLFSLERRFERRSAPYALWAGLMIASLTPMSIRWLTDGMETSLVALGAVVLALATEKAAKSRSIGISSFIGLAALGCLLVLLRVELILLVSLATITIWFARWEQRKRLNVRLLAEGAPIFLGAILGATCVHLVFGQLLPDTALAKERGFSLSPLLEFIHVSVSAFGFGVGLVLLTLISGILVMREVIRTSVRGSTLLALTCANACLPIELALSVMRGQSVQGFRYFVWPVYFTTLFNVLQWAYLRRTGSPPDNTRSPARLLLYVYFAIMLCLILPDSHYAAKAMRGRSQSFEAMWRAGLDRYHNGTLIAADIGWIGYFTGANICDLNGLVGGRDFAMLSHQERVRRCAESHPQILFLNDLQLRDISPYLPLQDWTVVQDFPLPNVNSIDRHYLMVPRSEHALSLVPPQQEPLTSNLSMFPTGHRRP